MVFIVAVIIAIIRAIASDRASDREREMDRSELVSIKVSKVGTHVHRIKYVRKEMKIETNAVIVDAKAKGDKFNPIVQ